jgi:hypothetical protein
MQLREIKANDVIPPPRILPVGIVQPTLNKLVKTAARPAPDAQESSSVVILNIWAPQSDYGSPQDRFMGAIIPCWSHFSRFLANTTTTLRLKFQHPAKIHSFYQKPCVFCWYFAGIVSGQTDVLTSRAPIKPLPPGSPNATRPFSPSMRMNVSVSPAVIAPAVIPRACSDKNRPVVMERRETFDPIR